MPPRTGKLDLKTFAADAPVIAGYKTEALTLKGAQILNVLYEIDDDHADALIPATMHPAIPAYAIFNATHYPESPAGPCTIAEVRVAGRAGVRPRAFVLRSTCENEAARRELSQRWGYPAAAGKVALHTRHDRVDARVEVDGRCILDFEMMDRDFISGGDIQYIASMHLARNKEDGKLVVVQVDPEYVFSKAERGRPHLKSLEATAWKANGNIVLGNPISATFTIADVTLPRIRYICNPELPAFQGTTKVAA